ncbi:unnamed protein product [Haemonchus placei]|uniref:Uncharacterized protein n=1 Tax=Haemonchus placei TaxID=6290 RepID=A0A3P8CUN1_HAEPC|nr:unnamed protein product [Haemonchus placei]
MGSFPSRTPPSTTLSSKSGMGGRLENRSLAETIRR